MEIKNCIHYFSVFDQCKTLHPIFWGEEGFFILLSILSPLPTDFLPWFILPWKPIHSALMLITMSVKGLFFTEARTMKRTGLSATLKDKGKLTLVYLQHFHKPPQSTAMVTWAFKGGQGGMEWESQGKLGIQWIWSINPQFWTTPSRSLLASGGFRSWLLLSSFLRNHHCPSPPH